MKKHAVICAMFVLCPLLFYADSITREAEIFIMQKDYAGARKVLIQGLRNPDLNPLQRAEVLSKLAWFYDELAGSSEEALRYYYQITELPLEQDSEFLTSIKGHIKRLEQNNIDFKTENNLISVVRMETSDKNEAAFRIDQLKALIRDNPDYPGIALAYYYLGIHYMVLEKYNAAHTSFKKAFAIKPALDFLLPIHSRMELSLNKHLYFLAKNLSFWCLLIITIVSLLLFTITKPWQWIKVQHLLILLAVTFTWAGSVLGINFVKESSLSSTTVIFEQPVFFNNTPWGPGSWPLFLFFLYMLPGFFIVFIFTAAASRFSFTISMHCISGLVAFLLLTAISIIFYIDVCLKPGIFEPAHENYFPYLNGKIYFRQPDIEPYILTNPRLYPDLELDNLDEHMYREWMKEQYRIIKQTDSSSRQGVR